MEEKQFLWVQQMVMMWIEPNLQFPDLKSQTEIGRHWLKKPVLKTATDVRKNTQTSLTI